MPAHSAAKITAGELVLVCSRYDLGDIRSLRRFKGGSRQSPKVLIASERGLYLLKRRAPAPSDSQLAHRVALSHEVQLFLASRSFPVAPIIGTRHGNNSLLELNGFIYEVFGFIRGRRYDKSPPAAHESGRLLAHLHHELRDFTPRFPPSSVTYHAHPAVGPTLADLPSRLNDPSVKPTTDTLAAAYQRATIRADQFRIADQPQQLIHGDWHPGNLLFSESSPSSIAAVLDFDSVRIGPPILDLANGAFQFAVSRRTPDSPDDTNQGQTSILSPPPRISLRADAFSAFHTGYRAAAKDLRLPTHEAPVIPWLMIEAMVVETVAPIAATGRFGKLPAAPALAMTAQAVEWVAAEADKLVCLATIP